MLTLLLDQISEETTALKLPAEASIPASLKSVLIHPAMIEREAAFTSPLVIMKRLLILLRRLDVAEIRFLTYRTRSSGFSWFATLLRSHPDSL